MSEHHDRPEPSGLLLVVLAGVTAVSVLLGLMAGARRRRARSSFP
jgi:hypothetical protein